MPLPGFGTQTLESFFAQKAENLEKSFSEFSLDNLRDKTIEEYSVNLVNAVLQENFLKVDEGKAEAFPSKNVHHSLLQGVSSIGLNLRDTIEKSWRITGPKELVEFMPKAVEEANRTQNTYNAVLIMGVGALDKKDILDNRKEHLKQITKTLEAHALKINNAVAEHRSSWIKTIIEKAAVRQAQLQDALLRKASMDDYLNS